jgi:nucleotide-binding universal stress UspA family protein
MSTVAAALATTSVARAVLGTAIQFGQLSGTDVEAVHVRGGPPDQLANLEVLTADAEVPLRIIEGPVEGVLCDVLGAPEVLVAVIGARAAAGGRTPVGRTALHLLGHVDKPVLVVPPETVAPGSIRRLLVPLEGGEASSRPVLEQLRPLLGAEVEVVVLHVFTEATVPAMLDRPGRDLEMFGREFLTRHCPTANSIELRPGPVALRVAEVSREYGADLVVLTWSRDTSAGRATVVREVLGASALPVLLLPVRPLGP